MATKPKKFKVEVCRIGYSFRTIMVRADSAENAEKIALDAAGNFDYSEKNADYESDGVREVEDDGEYDVK